jgi:hypothetical protein
VSEALDILSALVLENGLRWGEAAVAEQWADARAVLDENSTTPYHWLGRARGFSKTSDLAGMAIAAMSAQAPPRSRLYGLAADTAQGQLQLDAVGGFQARTPELCDALDLQEQRVIARRSEASLTVLPADSASIWGRRPYLAVIDEIAQWHDSDRSRRIWEGLSTAMTKLAGSRLVVLSTAGDPGHFSFEIRNQALDDPLWRVHEVEGPPPWMDEKRLAGEKRRLPESSYRRLFLNEWVASEDRLADEEDLLACLTLDDWPLEPQDGIRYVLSVDLAVKHDNAVAAICHAERVPGAELPRVVLDRLMVWSPSPQRPVTLSAVQDWVGEFARRYRNAVCVFDPSQGLQMMQTLKRSGLTVEEFSFSGSSVGKLGTTLLQLIRERALALPADEDDLLDELRNVRVKETAPGTFRLDHARGRHDDRAIALALAAHTLLQRPSHEPMRLPQAWKKRVREEPQTRTRPAWSRVQK